MPVSKSYQSQQILDPVGAVGAGVAGEAVDQHRGDPDRPGRGHVVDRLVAHVHGRPGLGSGLLQGDPEDLRVGLGHPELARDGHRGEQVVDPLEGEGPLGPEPDPVDVLHAVATLRKQPECVGPLFATGFCLGGTFAYLSSTRLKVDGAAAYYGTRIHHYLEEANKVACPLLLHFGEKDHTTPPDVIAKIREALEIDRKVEIHTYPGAKHAFANAMRPANHDPNSAALAHERTLAFFRRIASSV